MYQKRTVDVTLTNKIVDTFWCNYLYINPVIYWHVNAILLPDLISSAILTGNHVEPVSFFENEN